MTHLVEYYKRTRGSVLAVPLLCLAALLVVGQQESAGAPGAAPVAKNPDAVSYYFGAGEEVDGAILSAGLEIPRLYLWPPGSFFSVQSVGDPNWPCSAGNGMEPTPGAASCSTSGGLGGPATKYCSSKANKPGNLTWVCSAEAMLQPGLVKCSAAGTTGYSPGTSCSIIDHGAAVEDDRCSAQDSTEGGGSSWCSAENGTHTSGAATCSTNANTAGGECSAYGEEASCSASADSTANDHCSSEAGSSGGTCSAQVGNGNCSVAAGGAGTCTSKQANGQVINDAQCQ